MGGLIVLVFCVQYTQQHLNGQIAQLQQSLQTASEVGVRGESASVRGE